MKKALVIIDFQKGFFDVRNSWYVKNARKIIPKVIYLCSTWKKQDIFFTRFINKNLRVKKSSESKFENGKRETEIIKKLEKFVEKKNVFPKNGYSIFGNKQLIIKLKKYEEIFLCGLRADACVLFSISDGYERMMKIKVIDDAISGFDGFQNEKKYFKFVSKRFGKIFVDSSEAIHRRK